MKLADVCTIRPGEFLGCRRNNGKERYPVFGGAKHEIGYHDQCNVPENTIFMNATGKYAGYITRIPTRAFITDDGFVITKTSFAITNDYLFFYLRFVLQPDISKIGFKSIDRILNLPIMVPSVKQQSYLCSNLQVRYKQELQMPERKMHPREVYEENRKNEMLSLLQLVN